jgi:glycosyltransferase involved in cell wall biosynthesis
VHRVGRAIEAGQQPGDAVPRAAAAESPPMSSAKRRIHVLQAIAGLGLGGAERVVANLCRHLDPERFRVSVAWHVALGPIGRELREAGYDVFGYPDLRPGWSRYRHFRFLADLMRQERVDIVHSHDTACLADVATARLRFPAPRHVHTFHYGNYPHLPARYLWMERLFCRLPHRLVAVGARQRAALGKALLLPVGRIDTIDNGVAAVAPRIDASLLPEAAKHGSAPVIGSISTLTEQKGIEDLLEVAQRLKTQGHVFVMVVAGDGHLRPSLEQAARARGVDDCVRFLGWVSEAAARLLPAFDVFVQPSRWEANSMVLLEAMAAGRAIVTTDVGENRRALNDGECGIIVPVGDVAAMASKLAQLLASAELRQTLGTAARARFAAQFTSAAMAARYAGVYAELAATMPRAIA